MAEEYAGGLLPYKNRNLTTRDARGALCYVGRDGCVRYASEMDATQIREVLEKLEELEAKEKLVISMKGMRK